MTPTQSKTSFAIGLFFFCCAYWMLDSAWSYLSFEENLSVLIFQEPMTYLDTVLLKVPPYQLVSRIMVTGIFIVTGSVIAIFIFEQKEAEKEKIRLERQLQQAQKMESIGTLAGGISHDFNNILYGTIGYADLCLDDAKPGTQLYNNLEAIKSGLMRAKSLTEQILAFSRHGDTDSEPIQVAPVVNEVVRLLKSTMPPHIEIALDTNVTDSTIMGNPTNIHQIMMNLCTNAVHAMEEKGGTLKITLENITLDSHNHKKNHTDLPPGAFLRLRVSDTGAGIATDDLNRVFDPYFTSKEQGKGTGLGLAVVHGIVKSYNGRIEVDSRLNEWTRFDIYFPLWEQNRKAAGQIANHHLPGGNEHVLLVDDRGEVLQMQSQFLKTLGYTVSEMTSGLEAIDAVKKPYHGYRVIITDMNMPELPGDEFAESVKKIAPDIGVILCTSYRDRVSNTRARAAGIDAFLMKPVSNKTLAKMVRTVLDNG